MPKYLFESSYTVRGEEGVRAKGGTDRRKAVADTVESVGGKLECFYYAFGDSDVISIADLPDDEAAAAASLMGNASGGVTVKTTVLLTPEQIDEAAGPRGHLPPAGALATADIGSALDPVVHVGDTALPLEDPGAL
jgi:uncharacterized protein with GYD domain